MIMAVRELILTCSTTVPFQHYYIRKNVMIYNAMSLDLENLPPYDVSYGL